MFIECIQLVNSTTMISLTKNDENVFLNIFRNPLSDRKKKIISICNSFNINFSKDKLLNYLYSLSLAVKHR